KIAPSIACGQPPRWKQSLPPKSPAPSAGKRRLRKPETLGSRGHRFGVALLEELDYKQASFRTPNSSAQAGSARAWSFLECPHLQTDCAVRLFLRSYAAWRWLLAPRSRLSTRVG